MPCPRSPRLGGSALLFNNVWLYGLLVNFAHIQHLGTSLPGILRLLIILQALNRGFAPLLSSLQKRLDRLISPLMPLCLVLRELLQEVEE